MEWLRISNTTEIEPNAFKLIGACTKRGEGSKIGYFGSGLKYAMAVFMREGIGLNIYSGKREVKIGLTKERLRDKTFDVITIDGEKTNMTTEMGPDWKLWQAIREVYCNALDENDHSCKVVPKIEQTKGVTSFYIKVTGNEQLETIIKNWDKYFCAGRVPVIEGDEIVVYDTFDPTNVSIYRKGIKCYNEPDSSLYDYNIDSLEITESRLLKYTFRLREKIAAIWMNHATKDMIDELLPTYRKKSERHLLEHENDWKDSKTVFNQAWEECLENRIFVPIEFGGYFSNLATPDTVYVDSKLLKALMKQFGNKVKTPLLDFDIYEKYVTVEPDERQSFMLKQVLDFYKEVGVEIQYEVIVGLFENKKVLGKGSNGKVVLSTRVFDMGRKKIAEVVMEEIMHIDSQASDESREFQNYLINQMVTMLENKHGVFL